MVDSSGIKVIDNLGFGQDISLTKLIGAGKLIDIINSILIDKLYYADKVKKINGFGLTQERILVVTSAAIYNVHKKSIKRCIPLKELGGITKTNLHSKNVME